MPTLPNGTFDWLKIYELDTYFPFSAKISLYKNRNIALNFLMLKLMLASKNIRMKESMCPTL